MTCRALFSAFIMVLCCTVISVVCQNADDRSPLPRAVTEKCADAPAVCEQLEKLRIAHEKKEFGELVARAEEALKISEELETSIAANKQLSDKDRDKLQTFEKLVRKIRSELGARDSEGDDNSSDTNEADDEPEQKGPVDVVSAFKNLRESTYKLVGEIRKSTRFTISAAAINSSNALLKLTRVLKFWK